jgi:hypothetical protein
MQILETAAASLDKRAFSELILFSPLRNEAAVNALLRIISEESFEATRKCAYHLFLRADKECLTYIDGEQYLRQALSKIKSKRSTVSENGAFMIRYIFVHFISCLSIDSCLASTCSEMTRVVLLRSNSGYR